MPAIAIKWLGAIKPDKHIKNPLLRVTIEDQSVTFNLIAHDLTATFKLIDGTFPQWRRVIPSTDKAADIGFNSSYLSEISKAIKVASDQTSPQIHLNVIDATSPCIITCQDAALLYILMPMRM